MAINQVDAAVVERMLSAVKALAMRAKLQSILSSLFTWAIDKHRIAMNPPARPTAIVCPSTH